MRRALWLVLLLAAVLAGAAIAVVNSTGSTSNSIPSIAPQTAISLDPAAAEPSEAAHRLTTPARRHVDPAPMETAPDSTADEDGPCTVLVHVTGPDGTGIAGAAVAVADSWKREHRAKSG